MRLLLATDFSPQSDRALRRAVLIAKECDAAITVAHVVEPHQSAVSIERQSAIADRVLTEMAKTIAVIDGVPANVTLAVGDVAEEIDRVARKSGASLILMGPHRKQFVDLFAGTVAHRIIGLSRQPVLLANAVPSASYRSSLLALDLDEASGSTLAAVQLPFIRRSRLAAVHLFDAPMAAMMKRTMQDQESVDHYLGRQALIASSRFKSFIAESEAAINQCVVRPHDGSPTAAILACADELNSDLIVVGTNQRIGLERLLLGSVAQGVLLGAKRDVLVVPSFKPRPTAVQEPVETENVD